MASSSAAAGSRLASIFSSAVFLAVMASCVVGIVADDDMLSLTYGPITSHDTARAMFALSQELVRALQRLRLLGNGSGSCYIIEHVQRGTNVTSSSKTSVGVSSSADDVTQHVTDVSLRLVELRLKNGGKQAADTESWCTPALYRRHVTVPPAVTTTATNSKGGDVTADDVMAVSSSNESSRGATERRQKVDGHDEVGLNKRQVLVISTCSTVIGLFSIVALILRLRNCLKRNKQDKEGTRRHVRSLAPQPRQHHHHASLENFATGPPEGHHHDRRWSQFNPFSTDR